MYVIILVRFWYANLQITESIIIILEVLPELDATKTIQPRISIYPKGPRHTYYYIVIIIVAGFGERQVPFSMAIGNEELMHECFPHTCAWEQE